MAQLPKGNLRPLAAAWFFSEARDCIHHPTGYYQPNWWCLELSGYQIRPKRCKHHKISTCVLMILNPRSFSYPNSVSWFSWYRDARRVFPENRPGAAASQIELVISRILNRWKAKILLVPEEATVKLICFLLRSSCLQHPSRTMGAHGLWMKQQLLVDFWGFRHASLTKTYQFLNILESTLQPWMLLCDCVNIQMSTTQTLKYFVRHT